ncbi:MAG: hypothetical protein HOO86_02915 [Bacteroidales bacterium]|nr:hypothetical protein [Bacteroidales bacterium]
MKKTILIMMMCVLFSHFTLQAQVQDQNKKKFLYESKVQKFNTMRNAGIVLTIGGAVLTIAGISTMSNAIADDPDMVTDAGTSKFLTGYLCTALGLTASGGGIVLWAIGGAKKRSYTQKLNSLSLNLNPAPRQMVSLAYRF